MKQIEKDLTRYMPSQLPVPNAPVGLMEFWNPQNHGEIPNDAEMNERAVRHIAENISVDYEIIKNYTWAQHNLIWNLHRVGNDSAARAIANDIDLTHREREIHRLLVRNAALLIYEHLDDWGHEGLDENELNATLKEIVKTNADWPKATEKWQQILKKELQTLRQAHYTGPETGFGPMYEWNYWTVK